MKGKHKTALTSSLSWAQIKAEGKNITQRDYLRDVIETTGAVTSRQLVKLTGLERASITRCVNDLLELELISIAKTDKCETTNRMVSFYTIPEAAAKYADGVPLPATGDEKETVQTSLFAPNSTPAKTTGFSTDNW